MGETINITHHFSIGSRSMNSALRQELGISYEEAEMAKTSSGLNLQDTASNSANKVISTACMELLKSIKESSDLALAHCSELTCAYLVGGGSLLKNFDTALTSLLGIPIIFPNPFKRIDFHTLASSTAGQFLLDNPPYFSGAVGLALRGIE